jgi:GNAT superfamily N-acetyltransferase
MTFTVTVRPREPIDIPALCDLLAAQRPATGYPEIWPLPVPVPDLLQRDNELTAWVAEIGGEIVGHIATAAVVESELGGSGSTRGLGQVWAQAYGNGATTDQLRCIGVLFADSTRARAGIGSALLAAATEAVKAEGAYPVLDCITEKTHVVDFYRKRGWKVVHKTAAPWSPEKHIEISLMIIPELARK